MRRRCARALRAHAHGAGGRRGGARAAPQGGHAARASGRRVSARGAPRAQAPRGRMGARAGGARARSRVDGEGGPAESGPHFPSRACGRLQVIVLLGRGVPIRFCPTCYQGRPGVTRAAGARGTRAAPGRHARKSATISEERTGHAEVSVGPRGRSAVIADHGGPDPIESDPEWHWVRGGPSGVVPTRARPVSCRPGPLSGRLRGRFGRILGRCRDPSRGASALTAVAPGAVIGLLRGRQKPGIDVQADVRPTRGRTGVRPGSAPVGPRSKSE